MNAQLKAIAKIALGVAEMIAPEVKIAEAAIVGLKKGGDRKAAVVNLAIVSPILAELLSGHEIVNNDLWREAIGDLNDFVFKAQKALKEKDAPPADGQ